MNEVALRRWVTHTAKRAAEPVSLPDGMGVGARDYAQGFADGVEEMCSETLMWLDANRDDTTTETRDALGAIDEQAIVVRRRWWQWR